MMQDKNPHLKVVQDNTKGWKESQKHVKDSETHHFPLLGILQDAQENSPSIYSEDLVQTNAGPILAASVSVTPLSHP